MNTVQIYKNLHCISGCKSNRLRILSEVINCMTKQYSIYQLYLIKCLYNFVCYMHYRLKLIMNLFGKRPPPDPKKFVRESSAALRKQERVLDRQIRSIQREEDKVKLSIKQAAKKGDKTTCGILAKEIINTRKAKSRIYTAKANIKSVELTMKQQAAMVRTTGALEKSTKVMESMQKLIKVSEVRDSMLDLQKEMMKMGIVDEMLDDTFSALDEDEELEEATQAEIDKVLQEITAGALKPLPDSEDHALPNISAPEEEEDEDEEDEENMQRRLAALRS